MIARRVRPRSGITLTEILISILIMGIGMISLAVLFPLGLLKLREATRNHRSPLLAQAASNDFNPRALLTKETFTRTWYGGIDPFTSDSYNGVVGTSVQSLGPNNLSGVPQPGLPICYDPYWRAFTQVVPPNGRTNNALFDQTLNYPTNATTPSPAEARFGAAIIASGNTTVNAFSIRTTGLQDAGAPSAYGLQRITNFIPISTTGLNYLYPFTYNNLGTGVVSDIFVSPDDTIFNSRDNGATGLSPLVPDLTLSGNSTPVADFRYSWFFTGFQVDSTSFQGDVVVCESRPFAFATLPPPNQTVSVPEGETVVEAIFGYSEKVGALGLSVGADKTVLLRWPNSIPDPSIRIGSWIADVTYERTATTSLTRSVNSQSSFQRCNWYQINKRTDPQNDPDFPNQYRRMIVTIASPVKTKTLLTTGGLPQYVNAALIMPSVIYVYPRAFSQ